MLMMTFEVNGYNGGQLEAMRATHPATFASGRRIQVSYLILAPA